METAFYIVRFTHYAAALQLFGVCIFQGTMAPPDLRRHLHSACRAVALPSAWLLLISAVLWLAVVAATFGNGWHDAADPTVLLMVLEATAFGPVWVVQLILSLILVMMFVTNAEGQWLWAALLAGLALGGLGLIGHATIDSGMIGLLSRVSQALHLLASGFWIGSLAPLLACLAALKSHGHIHEAGIALHRFSGLGHFAVALVIATGLLNGSLLLEGGGIDLVSTYQLLLLAKVSLVGTMILLAIVNRYIFMPAAADHESELAKLRLGTIAEIVLSAGVIALVSILGALSP